MIKLTAVLKGKMGVGFCSKDRGYMVEFQIVEEIGFAGVDVWKKMRIIIT